MYSAKLTIKTRFGTIIDEYNITGAGTAEGAYIASNEVSQNVERRYPWDANYEITVYDETGEVVSF